LKIDERKYRYLQIRYFFEKVIIFVLSPIILCIISFFGLINFFFFKLKIFYQQKRPGLNTNIFTLYKFRTIDENGAISNYMQFLRNHRIDELPQFLNILKGDMSLIGPRPEPMSYYEKIILEIPEYSERYCIKPGLTGLAQVKFKHTINVEESAIKLKYDFEYIENIGIKTDLMIIFQSLKVILNRSGAR
jgi:lipopolysaccharide/colanic/teichoic acid biosynthesis glycosyltransferase